MAPLPKTLDLEAVKLRQSLGEGKQRRAEVKARVLDILAAGTAKPPMQKLAAELFGAKRGRQATGLYKWFDIGSDNYWLDVEGRPHKERMQSLSVKYRRSEKHVEACVTFYNKAVEEGRP